MLNRQPILTIRLLVGILLVSGVVSGCAPAAPYSRMSVGGTPSGGLVVGYRTCGERVTSLTVRNVANGEVVWKLAGTPGSRSDVYSTAVADPALPTSTPFKGLTAGEYSLTMTTSTRTPGTLRFSTQDLQPGYVVWDRGVESEDVYRDKSDQELGCPT